MEIFKHLIYAVILLLVFVLLHLVRTQDQSGFISLDCGLPKDTRYTEPTTKIEYISDAPFISTGISKSILPEHNKATHQQQVAFVRNFPLGTRNCYKLNVTIATKYLIRATFLYGNYDGQNKLPKFDMHLGPNFWVTVSFSSVSLSIMKEPIHITSHSQHHLQICFVNTNSGIPFINALELRPLQNYTYVTSTGSLALDRRLDFGSTTNQSYRYPYDIYDRLWTPCTQKKDWTTVTNSLPVNQAVTSTDYQPPSIVMNTSATPLNASAPLEFNWEPQDKRSPYYLCFHFAELQLLQSNQSRAFDIYLNGYLWFHPRPLIYLKSDVVYSGNTARDSNLSFSLVRSANSTLPPILNALEAYTIIEFSQPETHQDDVDAITKIKSSYRVSRNWQGDPCAPVELLWSGLNCNYEDFDIPRIISLNLSSSGLTREISFYISNLTMLKSLDLSNNSLTGSVPDFLSQLEKLSVLNLKGNMLSGSVPAALIRKSNNGFLSLSIEENQDPCTSLSCKKKNNMLIPIVSSIGSLVVLLNVAAIFVVLQRIKQDTDVTLGARSTVGTTSLEPKNRQFTYAEVLQITNNFERTLGKGGFGTVYHGLIEGTEVAVKMLSSSSVQGYKQFQAEVKLLMRVYHGNLTSLVGYCNEGTKMALIYEYMANGSLESYLYADGSENVLSWQGRLQVALDAAQGLEYLHSGCKPPIVHRDVKTSNILLARNFQAKLADFGLSKTFPTDSGTHVSTAIAGTPGYLDPEYYKTNRLNEKSDVYSFGVVLLQIITSQPAISRSEERTHISQWVSDMAADGDIRSVVEPQLQGDFEVNSVWKAVEIAMACVSPTSSQRPNMNQVVIEIKDCLAMELARKNRKPLTHLAAESSEMFYIASSAELINPLAR
ncbi:LRR receptor-like serine/threonine-protein kinase IOS1 isoform X2 [Ziziphus jujuba]|uniref:non-specific serine/threonine protein kinase n=1 Tax=Ziziphus jujuba TaxID=326968 RepID=A0ABM4A6J8_ZIZJJ|nr:LRR receptor-like serine/threonine-protein kinase IOS1 isoform X2 [Ziziphus jujuba]